MTLYVKNAVIANLTAGNLANNAITNVDQISAWTSGGSWVIGTSLGNLFGPGSTGPNRVVVPYDANGKNLVNFQGSFTRGGGHSPTVTLNLYRYRGTGTDDLLAQSFSGGSGVTVNQPFGITFCDTTPMNATGVGAAYYITAISDDASVTVNNGVLWAMGAKR